MYCFLHEEISVALRQVVAKIEIHLFALKKPFSHYSFLLLSFSYFKYTPTLIKSQKNKCSGYTTSKIKNANPHTFHFI